MYETVPKKSNKAAHYTSAVLLVAAFAAMFFSASPRLPYRSVMQLAALVMLAFSILMMTRYTLCSYAYSVIEEDGGYDLTVTELKRKARITVCRIGLGGITAVTLAKRSDKEQSAKLKSDSQGRKTYNYCVDLAPAEYIHLLTEECGERIVIKLSYDERLFEILKRAEDQNKQVNIEP
jgi:hypothetical protein